MPPPQLGAVVGAGGGRGGTRANAAASGAGDGGGANDAFEGAVVGAQHGAEAADAKGGAMCTIIEPTDGGAAAFSLVVPALLAVIDDAATPFGARHRALLVLSFVLQKASTVQLDCLPIREREWLLSTIHSTLSSPQLCDALAGVRMLLRGLRASDAFASAARRHGIEELLSRLVPFDALTMALDVEEFGGVEKGAVAGATRAAAEAAAGGGSATAAAAAAGLPAPGHLRARWLHPHDLVEAEVQPRLPSDCR
jgi:hypothetical protein